MESSLIEEAGKPRAGAPMKILIAHNTYQHRGGEDIVFEQDGEMLAAAGFSVKRFSVSNDHIHGLSGKISAARSVISNQASIAALCAEVAAFGPDVVHIHNFFPTLSAGAIDAVARRGIPVVLTIHNFRLICAGALLLRGGKPCEDCVGHSKLSAVRYGCYRGSRIGSALVAAMGAYFKRLLKKHPRAITLIALTDFAKSRLIADGFPADRIVVRGNVISDPGVGSSERERRILYVGRLSPEKGVDTLLRAASDLPGTVEIIGDGPERSRLEATAPGNVVFRGELARLEVLERIKSATAIAVPSRWYETFSLVSLEAMATGTPVLASRIGALAEIVAHQETGLLVTPDEELAWKQSMRTILESPSYARTLGAKARVAFLERYSVETGVKKLAQIYDAARKMMATQI
jgi:glycosyltransferase involved in cell wall biosynthesis